MSETKQQFDRRMEEQIEQRIAQYEFDSMNQADNGYDEQPFEQVEA